jgi:succinate-semialdehyde dehydrogenase / glutarate-semialdehyde dehydrogenase
METADLQLGPNFFSVTVVKDGASGMKFSTVETCDTLASLVPFETEQEVIQLANDVEVDSVGYFHTRDVARLFRISEPLDVGFVGAGVGLVSAVEGPFGGILQSALGCGGGSGAFDEYLDVRSVTIGV